MKKLDNGEDIRMDISKQEKIEALHDDLLTVLESHIDEIETGELVYEAIKFMTIQLYEIASRHSEAFRLLRLAMEDGIKTHVSTHFGE